MPEVERKYTGEAVAFVDLSGLFDIGPTETFTLRATHVDTPDHRLAQAGGSPVGWSGRGSRRRALHGAGDRRRPERLVHLPGSADDFAHGDRGIDLVYALRRGCAGVLLAGCRPRPHAPNESRSARMTAEAMAIARPDIGTTIRNYISLTNPMIIALLLITTVPAMVVAERGWPSSWLVLATLIGGSLSAGGANAINCWYDRDIDGVMRRTQSRPLVTGEIEPLHGLIFGIALGAFAFGFLWVTTTPMAAA